MIGYSAVYYRLLWPTCVNVEGVFGKFLKIVKKCLKNESSNLLFLKIKEFSKTSVTQNICHGDFGVTYQRRVDESYSLNDIFLSNDILHHVCLFINKD